MTPCESVVKKIMGEPYAGNPQVRFEEEGGNPTFTLRFVDGMSLYRGYFGINGRDPHGRYDTSEDITLIMAEVLVDIFLYFLGPRKETIISHVHTDFVWFEDNYSEVTSTFESGLIDITLTDYLWDGCKCISQPIHYTANYTDTTTITTEVYISLLFKITASYSGALINNWANEVVNRVSTAQTILDISDVLLDVPIPGYPDGDWVEAGLLVADLVTSGYTVQGQNINISTTLFDSYTDISTSSNTSRLFSNVGYELLSPSETAYNEEQCNSLHEAFIKSRNSLEHLK